VPEAVHFAVAHQEVMERREQSVNVFGRASEAGYNASVRICAASVCVGEVMENAPYDFATHGFQKSSLDK